MIVDNSAEKVAILPWTADTLSFLLDVLLRNKVVAGIGFLQTAVVSADSLAWNRC